MLKHKPLVALILALSVLLLLPLTACQATATTAATTAPAVETTLATTTPSETTTGFPVELVDATGAKVILTAPPQAIIATNVWAGEMLLDMVDVSRITALSAWGDDPVLSMTAEKAAAVKNRVDISTPESIVALNPDLVILDTFSNPDGSLSKTLTEAGIPVVQMESPTDFTMIADAIMTLAQATGEIERGQAMVDAMNQTLDTVASQVASVPASDRVTVMFYEDYYDPTGNSANMLAAYGVGSPFHAIAEAAGTVNVCNVTNYSPVAKEKVVGEWQPHLLVIPSSTFDENFKAVEDGGALQKAAMMQDPVLQTLPAVMDGNILAIPDKYRSSTSHHMAAAVELLAKAAYPDLVQ
ncbi:MAG: ABC transporter substrate-binding protein [Eubacteriales bacterium]|nr:ABC transporter substrate-binding protein [Eubacteriales bacterium]